MNIKEQIREFIIDALLLDADESELEDDVSLLDEGVVDSTGVMELAAFVEDSFGVRVDDGEVVPENFDSVNNLVRFVERKTA